MQTRASAQDDRAFILPVSGTIASSAQGSGLTGRARTGGENGEAGIPEWELPAWIWYAREPLLTEEELASEVRRTIATVRRWRVEGAEPVFLSIGRAVRYLRVDVDRWLGERLVR